MVSIHKTQEVQVCILLHCQTHSYAWLIVRLSVVSGRLVVSRVDACRKLHRGGKIRLSVKLLNVIGQGLTRALKQAPQVKFSGCVAT
jgi:hypothetical protein